MYLDYSVETQDTQQVLLYLGYHWHLVSLSTKITSSEVRVCYSRIIPPRTHPPRRSPNEIETNTSGSRIILRLPIIPIEAKAGIGKGFLYDRDSSQDRDDIYDEFDYMEVFLEREVSDRYKLFRVKGDSMDDDTKRALCDGDIIICREVYPEDWKHGLINTKYPNVVIVIEEVGILIKQLIKHSKKKETISLRSLNSTYKDLTIDLKKVRAFY